MQESSPKNEIRSNLIKYAANILSRRPYFKHTLRQKLFLRAEKEKLPNPDSEIEKIISELSKSGYLDDEYLAEAFVRRQLSKCYGPRIISLKLKQLGLNVQNIHEAISSQATKEIQIEIVKKYFLKNRRLDSRKLSNKLFQRGFSPDIIRSCHGEISYNQDISFEDSSVD